MKRNLIAIGLCVIVAGVAASASAGRIVYIGADPTSSAHHPGQGEAVVLAGNAARWAGGSNDPAVGYVEADGCFGGSVFDILDDAGLTNLTQIFDLAAENLSAYDVVYSGPVCDTSLGNRENAAANVQAYVNAGGGLVVEPEIFDALSWAWVPYAGLIGHSGATNWEGNEVNIVTPGHPVMAGLTNAGLSNWSGSVHSTFSTPGAAGFTTLTNWMSVTGGPIPHIIALPEPASLSLLVLGGLTMLRRRK